MKTVVAGITVATLALVANPSFAADRYISGALSYSDLDSSDNSGVFVSNFTTGSVTGVTPPLNIPAGAPVGWNTRFDSDTGYSLAFGWDTDGFRYELEYTSSDSDILSHQGVSAAGIDLTAIDAGVLLTGNVGDLGISVGDLVAAGTGSVETSIFYVNGYYDFNSDAAFTPYVGLGIG